MAILVTGIFLLDLLTPLGVAEWLLYLLPIALSAQPERPRAPLLLATACTGLTALGYLFSPSGIDPWTAALNRAMGVFALWVVALSLARGVRARVVLRESEARLRTIVESSADGMLFADARDRCVDVNRAGGAMLGYAREEILGLNVADLGLFGMRERLRQLGGELEIDSGPGGTTVRAILPLKETPE